MPFDHILGQPLALEMLKRALSSQHVGQAYRFEGPSGVGKELTAYAFARALLCEAGPQAYGCGTCSSCQRVQRPAPESRELCRHPDLVLVARGAYTPEQLGMSRTETSGISVDQVRRVVLPRIGYPPHEGRALVFIIREAHELTVAAANALLKTLEEPPARVHFILVSGKADLLLSTVRSRTLAVRFGTLPVDVIRQILVQHELDESVCEKAQGSAEFALELAQPERLKERQAFLDACDAALNAKDLALAIKAIGPVAQDRQLLKEQLGFFAHALAERAKAELHDDPTRSEKLARLHQIVLEASSEIERNAQLTLLIEAMLYRLRKVVAH